VSTYPKMSFVGLKIKKKIFMVDHYLNVLSVSNIASGLQGEAATLGDNMFLTCKS
tara:strand:- start:123 stop:287 length:165 start_codon:yes stop_codon:yes gene_type:complete